MPRFMTLPKYRPLGLEVRTWQTCLKWRNTNTPTQAVQSNTVLYSLVDQGKFLNIITRS